MSQRQLAAIIQKIRDNPANPRATIAEMRQSHDQAASAYPLAEDVTHEDLQIAGCDAISSVAPGSRADRCVLYLHGGAYVMGHARASRALTDALGRAAHSRILTPNYRLAPENPFPAAVEDATRIYKALLDEGLPPHRIVLAGDSAGGGLAAATLLEAKERGWPMPAGACLISPWLDLTCSSESMTSKAARDPVLTAERLRQRAESYLGAQSRTNPLASPLYGDLSSLPPIYIQIGESEVLLDEAISFAAKAAHSGVKVRLDAWPCMIHVWHRFAAQLEEAVAAISEAGLFIHRTFDAAETSRIQTCISG